MISVIDFNCVASILVNGNLNRDVMMTLIFVIVVISPEGNIFGLNGLGKITSFQAIRGSTFRLSQFFFKKS